MKRTILIVEDTETCQEALELALTSLPGLEVRAVATAEAALEYLASGHICALVTDLHLPRMDGFELIKAIRSKPETSSLPVLVISGDSDPHTAARLTHLGADAYFVKPYSPAGVRGELLRLIAVRRSTTRLDTFGASAS